MAAQAVDRSTALHEVVEHVKQIQRLPATWLRSSVRSGEPSGLDHECPQHNCGADLRSAADLPVGAWI